MDKEDVVYTYSGILISCKTINKKINETIPFVKTWIDIKVTVIIEISQTDDKYYMISLICGLEKKKRKQTHRYRK